MIFCGIDPGKSGAVVFWDVNKNKVDIFSLLHYDVSKVAKELKWGGES